MKDVDKAQLALYEIRKKGGPGTRDMIDRAKRAGIEVIEV